MDISNACSLKFVIVSPHSFQCFLDFSQYICFIRTAKSDKPFSFFYHCLIYQRNRIRFYVSNCIVFFCIIRLCQCTYNCESWRNRKYIFCVCERINEHRKITNAKSICFRFYKINIAFIVYEIIYCIIEMVSLLVNKYYFDLANVVNSILYCGMIFISLIIGGLVLGYILFPEKYLKMEEQNEL